MRMRNVNVDGRTLTTLIPPTTHSYYPGKRLRSLNEALRTSVVTLPQIPFPPKLHTHRALTPTGSMHTRKKVESWLNETQIQKDPRNCNLA